MLVTKGRMLMTSSRDGGWKGTGKCFLMEMLLCSCSQLEEEEELCQPTEKCEPGHERGRAKHAGTSHTRRGAHSQEAKRHKTVSCGYHVQSASEDGVITDMVRDDRVEDRAC